MAFMVWLNFTKKNTQNDDNLPTISSEIAPGIRLKILFEAFTNLDIKKSNIFLISQFSIFFMVKILEEYLIYLPNRFSEVLLEECPDQLAELFSEKLPGIIQE